MTAVPKCCVAVDYCGDFSDIFVRKNFLIEETTASSQQMHCIVIIFISTSYVLMHSVCVTEYFLKTRVDCFRNPD